MGLVWTHSTSSNVLNCMLGRPSSSAELWSFLGFDPSGKRVVLVEVPLPGEEGKENLSSSQRSLILPERWKSFAIPQNKAEVQEINIISH